MKTPRVKLIEARKVKKWTQEDLANKVGISRAYLSHLELGNYTPSLEVAKNISMLLEISMEELFF